MKTTFSEITLSSGDAEVMVHVAQDKCVLRIYAYHRDVLAGVFPPDWEWRKGQNPLFVDLVSSDLAKFKRALHAMGFVTCSS